MNIIDEIKEQTDIVKLVSETQGTNLRRTGKNWIGFCPFHSNTHTPALVVFPDTKSWYCFGGCHEGGSVIDWELKRNPGWDVKEAVKELAQKAGISTPEWDHRDVKARLAERAREDAIQIASRLFQKWLFEDKEALQYAHSRGWTDETMKAERLGFSGRATAAQVKEMQDAFGANGIFSDAPDAVMILGYRGDMAAWCKKWNINPLSVPEEKIHGLMTTPGLVYSHKINGRIVYLSRRQLPGHDGWYEGDKFKEWKSFNPYAALAGERQPYFNSAYYRNSTEKIVIVEGQGDAISLGQLGIPAMALAGSAWKSLSDTIKTLQESFDTLYFGTDGDTTGKNVISGGKSEAGKYPLAEIFGPMLWVVNWPPEKWTKPDGTTKTVKDANNYLEFCQDTGVSPDEQQEKMRTILGDAKPIVALAAAYVGTLRGAERQKGLDRVVPWLQQMPATTLNDMRMELAKSLFPSMPSPIREFSNLIKEKKGEEDDGRPAEIVETMGGWYTVSADGNEGYLLEEIYDKRTDKASLAYAHIFLDGSQPREIGVVPFMNIGLKRYVPMLDDNVRVGTVCLPSELGPEKTTRELLAAGEIFIRRYFLLDNPTHYRFGSLYAVSTWVYDCFDQLLYLRARGGPGSGKSEFMLRLGLTCYRLMITSGVSSLAGFKGLAHLYKGTLFIDEVDNLLKDDKGEMRALLNVRAMKKQARVITMMETMKPDGTHGFTPATTFVYGPTLMTMYGAFKDPGTESRCLTFDLPEKESMELANAGIEPGYIPPEMEVEGLAIRNMLLRWRLRVWRPSIELTPEDRKNYKLMDPMVSPRINQIMRPLKVLAVTEHDQDLLNDLFLLGQANYRDEVTRRSGMFEAIIFRAVVAIDEQPEHAKYIHEGKLGVYGTVRFVAYKDLAIVANALIDAENLNDGDDKKKEGVKPKTIGDICRDTFRMATFRTGNGWVVILDKTKIEIGKIRFGMKDAKE